MGAVCGGGTAEQRAENLKNKHVSKAMQAARKENERSVKLLILGTGDSGKTTWRKQISNVYCKSFMTTAVRREMAHVVLGNLVQGVGVVAKASVDLSMPLSDDCLQAANTVATQPGDASELTPEVASAVQLLWRNAGFQKVYEMRSSYQLQDCVAFFAAACAQQGYPAWGGPGWVPTTDECVRARVRTSGIIEEDFKYKGINFRLFDAGGQRAERRKWIHCFDAVTAVIFVAASSEYDQVLFEDAKTNRLVEAVNLFESTVNSKWFTTTPVLLFLNKMDLFTEKFKVKRVALNVSGEFPTAPENQDDVEGALAWMSSLFIEQRKNADKEIYVHHTTATDPKNVESVFNDCTSIILQDNLNASGLAA